MPVAETDTGTTAVLVSSTVVGDRVLVEDVSGVLEVAFVKEVAAACIESVGVVIRGLAQVASGGRCMADELETGEKEGSLLGKVHSQMRRRPA